MSRILTHIGSKHICVIISLLWLLVIGVKAQGVYTTSSHTYKVIGVRGGGDIGQPTSSSSNTKCGYSSFGTTSFYSTGLLKRTRYNQHVSQISSHQTSYRSSRPLYRAKSTRLSAPQLSNLRTALRYSSGSGGSNDDWDAPGSWGDPDGGVGIDDDWTTPGSWNDPNGAVTPDDDWILPIGWNDPNYGFSQDTNWDTPNTWDDPFYVERTPIGNNYIILLFALLYLIVRVCVKKKLE